MKKIFLGFLACFGVASLCSCGDDSSSASLGIDFKMSDLDWTRHCRVSVNGEEVSKSVSDGEDYSIVENFSISGNTAYFKAYGGVDNRYGVACDEVNAAYPSETCDFICENGAFSVECEYSSSFIQGEFEEYAEDANYECEDFYDLDD